MEDEYCRRVLTGISVTGKNNVIRKSLLIFFHKINPTGKRKIVFNNNSM